MFHFHLQHLRSVCIRGKALGKACTADPQYFAARRQQRQLIALAGRGVWKVMPVSFIHLRSRLCTLRPAGR